VNAQHPASQSRHFTEENGLLHVPIDLSPVKEHPVPNGYTSMAGLTIRLGLEVTATTVPAPL
jgi:hypothetical protein